MTTNNKVTTGAKLGITGTMEYRDKDGNILKTVQVSGNIPLDKLGMSVEEAQQLITQQENK